jgi:tetratricopeptide (TPR) repeat protein
MKIDCARGLCGTLVLLVATQAWAVNPYVGQAKVFYQGLDYEKCLQRLESAAKRQSTPEEEVDIELYNGLCKYNLGQTEAATEHFWLALQIDPNAHLPYTSPKVQKLFEALQAKAQARLGVTKSPPQPAAALTPAPASAAAAPPTAESASPKARPLVPTLILGGLAAGALGVGVYFGVSSKSYESSANLAMFVSDADRAATASRQQALIANVSYAVAGSVALIALLVFLLAS